MHRTTDRQPLQDALVQEREMLMGADIADGIDPPSNTPQGDLQVIHLHLSRVPFTKLREPGHGSESLISQEKVSGQRRIPFHPAPP
jgi:hypothetical protein